MCSEMRSRVSVIAVSCILTLNCSNSADIAEMRMEPRSNEEVDFLAMEPSALDYLDPTLRFIRQKVAALKAHLETSSSKALPVVASLEPSCEEFGTPNTIQEHGFKDNLDVDLPSGKEPTASLRFRRRTDEDLSCAGMNSAPLPILEKSGTAAPQGAVTCRPTGSACGNTADCSSSGADSMFSSAMLDAGHAGDELGQQDRTVASSTPASETSASSLAAKGHVCHAADLVSSADMPSGSSSHQDRRRSIVPVNSAFLFRCEKVCFIIQRPAFLAVWFANQVGHLIL
jgi:hypothetical protein